MNNDVYEGLNPDVLKLALDQATQNVKHTLTVIEAMRQRANNLLLIVISVSSLMIPWILSKAIHHEYLFFIVLPTTFLYGLTVYHILKILVPRDLPSSGLWPDWFGEKGLFYGKNEDAILAVLRTLESRRKLGDQAAIEIGESLKKAYKNLITGSIALIITAIIVLFI